MLPLGLLLTLACAQPEALHVLEPTEPLLLPEDGLLLGNGDLSVSVYRDRDHILWRFGKGDVWDRRIDRSDDPPPAHIAEIAHGIAVEGWKCSPYGDGEPVALHGTDNPERMKELCRGTPPSYVKRPYPCPKPVGELSLAIPPDLPGLTVRQILTIEEGAVRTICSSSIGVELTVDCFIPPRPNVLVVRWQLSGWSPGTETTTAGTPPIRFSLYRWADPDITAFGQRFFAESGHGGFLTFDAPKCSPLPRPTARQTAGGWAIEQAFHADPTFPEGFSCLLTPLAPGASIEPVDLSSAGEARLRITPPAGSLEGVLAIAVTTTSDAGGAEAEAGRVRSEFESDPVAVADGWGAESLADARAFWARSSLRTSDPAIESLWYATYHARRATTRAGKPPPGLFLPSTVRDYSHWHGDYHTNYNLQQPFWGDYAANQLEVGDAYFDAMDYFLQMGRIIAQRYYGARGAFIQLTGYPILAEDDVLGAVPMGRMAYMTGWAAHPYWQRYLYTLDRDWLAARGYPAIRDCALFYLDTVTKGEDGLYHFFPSNQGEDGFTGDPKDYTDRPQVMEHMRQCLREAILASETLAVDPDLREAWRDVLANAAGNDGQPPEALSGLDAWFAEASPPDMGRGRPYARRADAPDLAPWPGPGVWVDQWYAGQYPMVAVPQLRGCGLAPRQAWEGFRRLTERWTHPNGLVWAMAAGMYGHAGAWTETLGICAPLQEMLLQGFGGVLRIFPTWPLEEATEFRTFRAEGAFLVSASCAEGEVRTLKVLSEKGAPCRLYSPWASGVRVRDDAGAEVPVATWQADILEFVTEAGRTYHLEPAR